jgi:hypothetical protein
MEDAPVIRIQTLKIQPEYEQRFLNWTLEAYCPLLISLPGTPEINFYRIVKENPLYTRYFWIYHYINRQAPVAVRSDQKWKDIVKDIETTWSSRIEMVWFPAYEQIASIKKEQLNPVSTPFTESKQSPVIHLEGYAFSSNEAEKYDNWFDKAGPEVFIPLLLRLPGFREYTRYKLIDIDPTGLTVQRTKRPVEYPPRLSILTFDDMDVFENYEKSLELAAFKYALQAPFPPGLNYQWYVQYQLERSYRK